VRPEPGRADPNLILFDYDGVIADTRSIFQQAFRNACAVFGLEHCAEDEVFLRIFEGNMMAGLSEAGLQETDRSHFLWVLKDRLSSLPRPRLFPGMRDVIVTLRRHFPLWIITSNASDAVKPVLEQAGIAGCFTEIMGADFHPDKTEKIRMVRSRFPESFRAWYIGDTLGDILEGQRAGCHTVAVTWGWHTRDILARGCPVYWAEYPEDLLRILGINHS